MLPDQTAKLPDAQEYRNAASQLLHGGFIVYHYFMPLFRALIALTGAGWGQLLADILLSTALIWLVRELTLAVFADAAAAMLAALWVAVYPQFIFSPWSDCRKVYSCPCSSAPSCAGTADVSSSRPRLSPCRFSRGPRSICWRLCSCSTSPS
jgi:hypothetical protein